MSGIDRGPSVLARRRVLLPLAAAAITSAFATAIAAARNVMLPGRPRAAGTSATRCAACGGWDHAMLDPRCPAAPRVL